MARLIDDEALRAELAGRGQERAKALLRWETERAQLLAAYEMALGDKARRIVNAPGLPKRLEA